MSESEQNKSVEEFVKFTCATESEARTYLENSGWNTEMALVMYYDDRDDRMDAHSGGRLEDSVGPTLVNLDPENDDIESIPDDDDPPEVMTPASFDLTSSSDRKGKAGGRAARRTTNVTTLASMRGEQEDEDEDEDQLYYAGGSEHSGQQIMGNDRRGDVAGEVFKTLKKMVTVGDVEVAGPSNKSARTFGGTGYRLGQTPDDTQVVGGKAGGGGTAEESRPELHLRLWREGFTIGDEPLRSYTDPENRETINLLLRGEIPLPLVPPGTKSGKVNVKVEDFRAEKYTGAASSRHFFTGAGHVLGNVVPEILTDDQPKAKPVESTQPDKPSEPIPSPIAVNQDEPTTSIQVRLPNGTRAQVRLNLTHTVEDLRRHLLAVHDELNQHEFAFMVSFPPKEVTDETISVSAAGLMNASVNLRMKK